MNLQRQIITIFFVLLFFTIQGCDSSIWNRYPPPKPVHAGLITGAIVGAATGLGVGGVVGGMIAGASFGGIIQGHMDQVDELQYNGVQVIQLGDEIRLILPTDRFFQPNSPVMNLQYYPIMDKVADFIKQFQKISIKVAGYTDNVGPWQRNLSLSKLRAQTVMQYLWNHGVDVRLIYAVGYGEKDPIANNATREGQAINRRIEITLRRIRSVNSDI